MYITHFTHSVTSVGATESLAPEVAAGFSSGGFSNYFPRPVYQDTAVPSYLVTLGDNNHGLFNRSGRAFPDVSFRGSGFNIVLNGQLTTIGGTSASAPSFAALVALLNADLLASKGLQLGFLNPLLYQGGSASIFNDITLGDNPGCFTNLTGFPAATGWDPVRISLARCLSSSIIDCTHLRSLVSELQTSSVSKQSRASSKG